jgi:hypothetical protein
MWPFTSNGSSKPTSDLEKELPDSLKGIFKQENPDNKHEALRLSSHQQRQVDTVVARSLKDNPYNFEFDDYKRNENVKKATYINCAQLQKNVLTCLKNWKATDLLFCDHEMKISAACTDVQTRALQKLHYDECVSIKQCQQIRFLVDDLFIKNFGENGDEFSKERCEGYFADVEESFDKVWKA